MYVSVWRSTGRCLPKVWQWWQRWKHISCSLWGGFWRAGNSVLAGESPNLHPVSLNDPHNEILVRGHAPTVVAFVFSKIHNTEQPLLVLPPEHSSFGCHITKISIFWDVLRKDPHGTFVHLSPDVLTTLACQQAGSLPGWEIMSTVITEVWHS